MTVSELLTEFDRNYMVHRLKPNTIAGYRVNIQKHTVPIIGQLELSELTYTVIDEWVSKLSAKALSNTTCKYVLATMRKALNFAVKRGYCTSNIIQSYDMPKPEKFQYQTICEEQLSALLKASADSDIFPAILLASCYGLRRGECIALHVADIQPDRISVRYSASVVDRKIALTTCKNNRERAILITPETYQALMKYDADRSKSADGYLLRTSDGNNINPEKVNRDFQRILKGANLPYMRFHDLRHSYATLMMKSNIHPKIVQQVLGHSDISVTLNLYSHADISMQRACLGIIQSL